MKLGWENEEHKLNSTTALSAYLLQAFFQAENSAITSRSLIALLWQLHETNYTMLLNYF